MALCYGLTTKSGRTRNERLRDFGLEIRTKSGAVRDASLSIEKISIGNEPFILTIIEDITERKRAEEALRKSEANLRAGNEKIHQILESINDGFFSFDQEWRMTYVNARAAEQGGQIQQELIGQVIWEAQPNLMGTNIEAAYRRVMQTRQLETVQYFSPRSRRWFELRIQPWADGISVYSMDITERKRAEEALESAHNDLFNERKRLLAVMEALPIGLAIYDQNGGVIQANPGFEAVWGSPRPGATSVDDYDLYQAWWVETGQRVQPEEWAAAQAARLEKTITGQFIRIRKFDGTEGYVLNSGAPVRDAQGQVIGATVAIMDITKLIEAENALRVSQDRFRVALKSVPIIVYTCDRELRYTWIYNPLRGFQAEEVLGKRDDEIISPEAAEAMIMAKQKALDTGQGGVQEVSVPLNGENTYYILTTEPIRDTNGCVTGLTCSAIDITEQKRMQEAQQEQSVQIEVQRQLMDHREQDRSAMARDLHDGPVQTLSSTMFHLQMLKDIFPDPAMQTELNQIGMDIKGTIGELRDMMNNLRPPALITFGILKVTQEYIEDLRARFPDLEIELNVEGDDKGLPAEAHLTLFRIIQAGINNIIRHSDASKAWVVIKIEQDSFYCELRDNGVGFDLRKDFSQLTREGHFGLVGMKERAEAIGAEFSVLSGSGKGTTIVVKGRLMGDLVRETSRLTVDS